MCFQKSEDRINKEEILEMMSCHTERKFESLLNGKSKGSFKQVQAPPRLQSRILSLLVTKKRELTRTEFVAKIWTPYGSLLSKYQDSWTNGASVKVLSNLGDALMDGKPFVMIGLIISKLRSFVQ